MSLSFTPYIRPVPLGALIGISPLDPKHHPPSTPFASTACALFGPHLGIPKTKKVADVAPTPPAPDAPGARHTRRAE